MKDGDLMFVSHGKWKEMGVSYNGRHVMVWFVSSAKMEGWENKPVIGCSMIYYYYNVFLNHIQLVMYAVTHFCRKMNSCSHLFIGFPWCADYHYI